MESLESVFERHHRDYSMNFLLNLSPVFLGRTKDLVRFKQILERVKNSENTNFVLLLKNEIEKLEMVI